MKSAVIPSDDLSTKNNEENKSESTIDLKSNLSNIKMKRLSTFNNLGVLSNCLLKPSFWATPNFKESDKQSVSNFNQRRVSALQIYNFIDKTESKLNSIIMWSPTLNRNSNVDLDQIWNKLRSSFKLKIQEIRSAYSKQADEEKEADIITINNVKEIDWWDKSSFQEDSISLSKNSSNKEINPTQQPVSNFLYFCFYSLII